MTDFLMSRRARVDWDQASTLVCRPPVLRVRPAGRVRLRTRDRYPLLPRRFRTVVQRARRHSAAPLPRECPSAERVFPADPEHLPAGDPEGVRGKHGPDPLGPDRIARCSGHPDRRRDDTSGILSTAGDSLGGPVSRVPGVGRGRARERYDVSGRMVKQFTQFNQTLGQISWDARDNLGNKLPSGVYFLKFQAENYLEIRKLLLIK